MDNSELLQKKMTRIDRGAFWCRALGIYFMVAGIVVLVLAGISLLQLLSHAHEPGETFVGALKIAAGALTYFVAAWLSYRASDAFESIAALIREMREIV